MTDDQESIELANTESTTAPRDWLSLWFLVCVCLILVVCVVFILVAWSNGTEVS